MCSNKTKNAKRLTIASCFVLSLSVIPSLASEAITSIIAENDTIADAVLGQPDLAQQTRTSGRGLSGPAIYIAVDKSATPNRVYVADSANHRILGWKNLKVFKNHAPADIVIGQPDFIANSCNQGGNPSAASLCYPNGIAVDLKGNLYVADSSNNRVLFYHSPFKQDKVADEVFGQFGSFTTNDTDPDGASENTLARPTGVRLDNVGNVYISDSYNNRVLAFYNPFVVSDINGTGDTTADKVFGQFDSFISKDVNNGGISAESLFRPDNIDVDAEGNLYIADTGNNRVLKFNNPLLTDTKADKVYGQNGLFTTGVCNIGDVITADSLCGPGAIATDGNNSVYIADKFNNRIAIYAKNSTSASKVLGQNDLTTNVCAGNPAIFSLSKVDFRPVDGYGLCNPVDIALDSTVTPNSPNVYVADGANSRILQYQPSPVSDKNPTLVIKSAQSATNVLGQYALTTNHYDDFNSRTFSFASKQSEGVIAIDKSVTPNRVYVADTLNHRVLAFKSLAAFHTKSPAAFVIGQAKAYTNEPNAGGEISASGLALPSGVAVDSIGNLYISDTDNNRVLIYNTPFSSDTVADKVLGQLGNFSYHDCNRGDNLGSDSLCFPTGLRLDGKDNLYVADQGNNRVLKYLRPAISDDKADQVYGQNGSFTSNACNMTVNPNTPLPASANSLCYPNDVALDEASNLYVADSSNNRVLLFTPTDTTADNVLGQPDMVTNVCNYLGVSAYSLCRPRAVISNSRGDVFVADNENNRVLKYTTPLTTDARADRVFWTKQSI
ncbi:NHL repeat-containing protein [Methylocucumis oryzae]|uniref:Teneurin NHL domain-containing protein n=1 Tax=Methylocucumis oryzae TaxID=1632867 RepID=A0A0F3IHS0_9GAMM|nr:NHL repeat-containing protein [Methylocucumis oryzae]KJV06296.1 hypothetical protein VZ94_12235 [Methylocucumis oryzae]